MSTPHRATPEQWAEIEGESWNSPRCSAIIELRARVEALELALRIQSGNLAPSEQAELGVVPAADMKAAAASTASKARGAALSKLAPPPFPLDPHQHQGPVEEVLVEQGVFKGGHGLEGLLNAEEFWSTQPYGTRLYYGEGGLDYLHRDVLRAAVQILASRKQEANRSDVTEARPGGPPADDTRALLLWLLWHHQGARSDVGQPIRDLLGMGRYEPMSDEQLQIAREWGDRWLRGKEKALGQPHPAPASTTEARPGGLVERVADILCCDPHLHAKARAAIREVAAWFTTITPRGSEAWRMASEVLRQEADHG